MAIYFINTLLPMIYIYIYVGVCILISHNTRKLQHKAILACIVGKSLRYILFENGSIRENNKYFCSIII